MTDAVGPKCPVVITGGTPGKDGTSHAGRGWIERKIAVTRGHRAAATRSKRKPTYRRPSTVTVPIMLLRLLVALLRLPLAPLYLLRRFLSRPKGRYVFLRLSPAAVEVDVDPPFWARFAFGVRKPPTRIDRVRDLVQAIVTDPSREGLIVRIDELHIGWATAEALREALEPLARAGKKSIAYLPRGGGEKEIFVALACDRIVTSPPSTFLVPGISSGGLYLGALFEKLGVRFERFARSEFKTAYETFERTSMSDGQRTQASAVLAGVSAALDRAYAKRSVKRADVVANGLLDAESAKNLGLVDALVYDDQLAGFVGIDPKKERFVPAGRYLAYREQRFFPKFPARARIAVVQMRGIIGEAGPASSVGAAIAAIRTAAKDPSAKAIVLHVDSPGGSALGSDLVHREIVCARAHKPVVASFGDVSASGGYYVSAPADAIVARPLTITGSIGVVAARPSLDGLVGKLGLVRETIGDAPHATLLDPTRPLSDETRAAFERSLDTSYARFVGIVAEGRHREASAIEPLARGRVYLGEAARDLGLVDSLGGYPDALARAEALARAKNPKLGKIEPYLVHVSRGATLDPIVPPSMADVLLSIGASSLRPLYFAPEVTDFVPTPELGLFDGTRAGLWSRVGAILAMRIPFLSLAFALGIAGLVGCGPSLTHTRPDPMPENGTYHGVWFSPQYGEMHLCQTNDNVVGEYTKQERHGTVRGTVDGNMLRFTWAEEREIIPGRPLEAEGHGYFKLKRDANGALIFEGEWGFDEDEVGGGRWTGVMQERQTPEQCYNSIRRTVPNNAPPGSDEIRFSDENAPPPPPSNP